MAIVAIVADRAWTLGMEGQRLPTGAVGEKQDLFKVDLGTRRRHSCGPSVAAAVSWLAAQREIRRIDPLRDSLSDT